MVNLKCIIYGYQMIWVQFIGKNVKISEYLINSLKGNLKL